MAKPVPIRVKSDDLRIPINGQDCFPHEGEWVEIVGGLRASDALLVMQMQDLGARLQMFKGDEDEATKAKAAVEEHFERLLQMFAAGVFAWNWTDLRGNPIVPWNAKDADGAPFTRFDGSTVDPFRLLRPEEQGWLTQTLQGESPAQEKKDGKRSPTTSSGTRRRRTPG